MGSLQGGSARLFGTLPAQRKPNQKRAIKGPFVVKPKALDQPRPIECSPTVWLGLLGLGCVDGFLHLCLRAATSEPK